MNADLGDKPVRMPAADLGSVFGPAPAPDRASALVGKLPPRPEPPPKPKKARPRRQADRPTAAPEPAQAPPGEEGQPAETTPRVAGPLRQVGVYVPSSVRDRLRAASTGLSQTGLILQALDATHEQLPAALAPPKTTGSLFAATRQRQRRIAEEPLVQITVRIPEQDLATIDRLVQAVGAPTRSVLITAALELHLPKPGLDA